MVSTTVADNDRQYTDGRKAPYVFQRQATTIRACAVQILSGQVHLHNDLSVRTLTENSAVEPAAIISIKNMPLPSAL